MRAVNWNQLSKFICLTEEVQRLPGNTSIFDITKLASYRAFYNNEGTPLAARKEVNAVVTLLIASGTRLVTLDDLRKVADTTTIPGIGPSRAAMLKALLGN